MDEITQSLTVKSTEKCEEKALRVQHARVWSDVWDQQRDEISRRTRRKLFKAPFIHSHAFEIECRVGQKLIEYHAIVCRALHNGVSKLPNLSYLMLFF